MGMASPLATPARRRLLVQCKNDTCSQSIDLHGLTVVESAADVVFVRFRTGVIA
jgi:hypothetical protein